MAAPSRARQQQVVKINPAAEVLQVQEGKARDALLGTLLWWSLRKHRVPSGSAASAADEESCQLLAPQNCLLQVTLSAIGLREVPTTLAAKPLPALHKLDLSFNEIESLGDKRGGLAWLVTSLPHIQELNLANNRLGSVPAELGELTSLRVLRLGSNGLHSLPAALKQLTELRELYLHGNKIPSDALEPILPAMPQLEVLDINHNLMRRLPDALLRCTNLLKLNADNNSIVELTRARDSGGPDAEGSDGNGGGRSAVRESARAMGENLPKLQRLYLANNELESAPLLGAELARWLPSLRVVDVSSNYGDDTDAGNDDAASRPVTREEVRLTSQHRELEPELEPEPEPEPEPGATGVVRCDVIVIPTLPSPLRSHQSAGRAAGRDRGDQRGSSPTGISSASAPVPGPTVPGSAVQDTSLLPPHPGPTGSTIAFPPIPKLCRDLVRAERFVEALEALTNAFFRGFTESYIVKFEVHSVLRRRGYEGEGYLAALTGRKGRSADGLNWQYGITFKANTLMRTSFAGLVRQLGHEFEHVRQFESGIFDFARQEFLAYGWMLEGAEDEGEGGTRADKVVIDYGIAGGSAASDYGGRPALPPLSQEEQLTIAAQVNEFWRMLPAHAKADPAYEAVHTRAEAVRARCGGGAGQQPLVIGQLLGSIEPKVGEAAAMAIQTSWRRKQGRMRTRADARAAPPKSGAARACQSVFGNCGCGISRKFIG